MKYRLVKKLIEMIEDDTSSCSIFEYTCDTQVCDNDCNNCPINQEKQLVVELKELLDN